VRKSTNRRVRSEPAREQPAWPNHWEPTWFSWRSINGILEPFCDGVWNVNLALVNRSYGRKQFPPQHVFMKIGLRSQGQGLANAIFVIERADHNEARLGRLRADCSKDFFSADNRQIPIKEGHVRSKVPELLYGLLPVSGFAHYNHVRLSVYDSGDSFPHPRVIVNYEHAYFSRL